MSKPFPYQVTARALEIIADGEHWLQGELARAADHTSVGPTDADAVRFCAVGAVRRAAQEIAPSDKLLADRVQNAIESYMHLHHPHFDDSLENLNDEADHATVIRLLKRFLAAQ